MMRKAVGLSQLDKCLEYTVVIHNRNQKGFFTCSQQKR